MECISKKKIVYIVSDIDRAISFEWIVKEINKDKFELSFILLNNKYTYLENFLLENNTTVIRIPIKSKKRYLKGIYSIYKNLKILKPDIVHTHLRVATILGISAARFLNIKKRIYTRHHSTYNHDHFPHSVKLDKLINYLATDIIAISQNVKNVLIDKEGVSETKIHLIHHGFQQTSFMNVPKNEVLELKNKYVPPNKYPVIGVIARYINWKGHYYQINAFKEILKKHPNAYFIFANADGPDKQYVKCLLKKMLPIDTYREIVFEKNLFALYKIFDIYVHTPTNKEIEAFGQTYIEALAAGIPSVFTLSGVANEFIKHNVNALVVDHKSSDQIFNAINNLINNDTLITKITKNGLESIDKFKLEHYIYKLELLYS